MPGRTLKSVRTELEKTTKDRVCQDIWDLVATIRTSIPRLDNLAPGLYRTVDGCLSRDPLLGDNNDPPPPPSRDGRRYAPRPDLYPLCCLLTKGATDIELSSTSSSRTPGFCLAGGGISPPPCPGGRPHSYIILVTNKHVHRTHQSSNHRVGYPCLIASPSHHPELSLVQRRNMQHKIKVAPIRHAAGLPRHDLENALGANDELVVANLHLELATG